jgi:hypothetical protein
VAGLAGSVLLGYVIWRIVKSRKNKPDLVVFGRGLPDFETAKAELVRRQEEEARRKGEQRKREEEESRLKYEDDIELNEIRIRYNQDPDRDLELGPTLSRGPWEKDDDGSDYGPLETANSHGEYEQPGGLRIIEEPDEELDNMRRFYDEKHPEEPRGRHLEGGGYEI